MKIFYMQLEFVLKLKLNVYNNVNQKTEINNQFMIYFSLLSKQSEIEVPINVNFISQTQLNKVADGTNNSGT